MYNFCTLFDSNYLSRGLAMYWSLRQHCSDFYLYIFAFDDITAKILKELELPHTTIIPLKDFEDEPLLAVKLKRSVAEYCWTCTSSTIRYVFNTFNVDMCTYIDADLFFYASPEPLFREMGQRSILLTEHRFSPMYLKDEVNGRFCVQFISFKNDERGMKALNWWRERCLEWCYAKLEGAKFGDQGYLNDWEERFEGVHVLRHLGGGVAPWNVQQYRIYQEGDKLFGTEFERGRDFELIFFHFHYVKFLSNGTIDIGRRRLSQKQLQLLYKPYVRRLEELNAELTARFALQDTNGTKPYRISPKTPLIYLYRKLNGVYHVYNTNEFIKE